MRGPRRAAAFLGLTERFLEGELPRSLSLGGNMQIRMLPDPIPEDLAAELGSEFRHWIISNALRELDQFLSLMLDECWDLVEACRIVSGEQPANYQWRRIDIQTNVAAKHRRVLEAAGKYAPPHTDDNEYLETLSNARNCIAHNLGLVDQRRAPDGSMRMRWLHFRIQIAQGNRVYNLDEIGLPFQLPGGEEGRVQVEVVVAEREFRLGERVAVSPRQLLQIALLYQMIIERLGVAISERAREAGVVFPDPATEPQPA